MLLIDSSIVIAAFREQEEHHKDALSILASAEKILLLDVVLLEIITVLKMREGHTRAIKCMDFLTKNKDIIFERVNDKDFFATLDFFKKYKNNLSFVDTTLLTVVNTRNIPLATFDKDLQKEFS